jgi:hypothetical protein
MASSAGSMVARKVRQSRGHELMYGYLVEPQIKYWRLSGQRWDSGVSKSFDVEGHTVGSWGLRREDADCSKSMATR